MFIVWALLAANVGIAMQTRLMIMALPISSVLGAISVDALAKTPEKPIHISFIVRVSIVLTMVFGLKETLTWFNPTSSYMLGKLSREDYLF